MAETVTRKVIREEVAAELRLRFPGTISGSAGTSATMVEASDLFSEAQAPLAAYLVREDTALTTRRITSFTPGTGAMTLNRSGITDGAGAIYLILTPLDWNRAINLALRSQYFTDRLYITPVADQSLYSLPGDFIASGAVTTEALDTTETDIDVDQTAPFQRADIIRIDQEQMLVTAVETNRLIVIRGYSATTKATHATGAAVFLSEAHWLQTVGQVERVFFQHISSDGRVSERAAPAYSLIQDANAVQLLLAALPETLDGVSVVVEGRHFYEELTTETATTTCPRPLLKAAAKVEALRMIWATMGEAEAKQLFGQEMLKAEQELVDQKRRWVRQAEPAPLAVRESYQGPEFAISPRALGW
ncbi:MAG: hypothetical protein QW838_04210 [Candidatus Nitrosotenuis sp.]